MYNPLRKSNSNTFLSGENFTFLVIPLFVYMCIFYTIGFYQWVPYYFNIYLYSIFYNLGTI
uniref:Uncharacterized protein n=1 Tax=Octopus bimaculoides TaxID=37653 RepID=A0A0L8HZL4_OCTBM